MWVASHGEATEAVATKCCCVGLAEMAQLLRMKSYIMLCVMIQFSKHGWLRNFAVID